MKAGRVGGFDDSHLVCDLCGVQLTRGGGGNGIEGVAGCIPGSDCPACAGGALFDPGALLQSYDDDYEVDAFDDAGGEG